MNKVIQSIRKAGLALLGVLLVVVLAGCAEASDPASPEVDAVPELESAMELAQSFALGGRQILMLDACDEESFNAAFGPGTCSPPTNRQGGIPFSTFVALLEKNQKVDAWRFAPDIIRTTRPVTMAVPNRGGIPHSFTEVEEFGGGFIPILNELSGNLLPAPECVHPEDPTLPHPDVALIPPGGHDEVGFVPGEEKKYMCCIHPWMRATSH